MYINNLRSRIRIQLAFSFQSDIIVELESQLLICPLSKNGFQNRRNDDLDDDNDFIRDAAEIGASAASPVDTDGDGDRL